MIGRLKGDQEQFFYSFCLDDVPDDHRVREIAAVLDLSWVRGPRGAQFEFTLAAIAQNLRRLARLVVPPPLATPCVA